MPQINSFLRVGLVAGLLFSNITAFAYIPPGWFLVKNMTQKKRGFKWVRIRSTLQEVLANDSLGEKLKVVTVMDYEKENLKTTVSLESGSVLQTKEEALSHTHSGVGAVLLFGAHPETVMASLKALGFVVPEENGEQREGELSFLSRVGDRIVWGIGNRELPPQLLIEKDKFLPVKMIAKINGEAAEVAFGPFQFSREFPYSSQINARVGAERLKETFEDALVLSSADKDKKKLPDPVHATPTEAQARLIQKYLEVLR